MDETKLSWEKHNSGAEPLVCCIALGGVCQGRLCVHSSSSTCSTVVAVCLLRCFLLSP